MNYPFFKKENGKYIFTGYKMKVYIPKDYFDESRKLAKFYGTKVETIGMIFFRVFKDEEDTKGSSLFQMKLTQKIFINFTESTVETGKLAKSLEEDTYYILTLYTNMAFIESLLTVKHFTNLENCVKLFNVAKIPQNIKYSELLDLYLNTMELNSQSLRMQSSIIECMVSDLCRNKDDLEEAFRMTIAKNPNVSDINYQMISIKDLAMVNSTFTAITLEDINRAILTSVNKTQTGGLEKETPIEKTIKY